MNLPTAISLFRSYGGVRVLRQYRKLGLLWPIVKAFLSNPFSRTAYRRVYSEAMKKVEPFLVERYGPLMRGRKEYYSGLELVHERKKVIWFCWLQGLDGAPEIVRVCHDSLRRYLPDSELIVIDSYNLKEYVALPDFIMDRWERQEIPHAMFADLLRLELLVKYGGTWVDATVLCTGTANTAEYLDTDLFMFQYTRPGSGQWRGISNWFITSCTDNEVLMVLRDLLHAYWSDFDCVLDYYIFHFFFSMLRSVYPEEIAAMPYGYSSRSLALMHHIGDKFEREKWDRLVGEVSFHKLPYRVGKAVKADRGNYYNWILKS